MHGNWTLTWHEDGRVNPGVPDISYVMSNGNYETGWLELKVPTFRPMKLGSEAAIKIGIRADQRQWILTHHHKVPVHILIQIGETYVLLEGRHVDNLMGYLTWKDLGEASVFSCTKKDLRDKLTKALTEATDRFRDVE
jgi:hypothetical protein